MFLRQHGHNTSNPIVLGKHFFVPGIQGIPSECEIPGSQFDLSANQFGFNRKVSSVTFVWPDDWCHRIHHIVSLQHKTSNPIVLGSNYFSVLGIHSEREVPGSQFHIWATQFGSVHLSDPAAKEFGSVYLSDPAAK